MITIQKSMHDLASWLPDNKIVFKIVGLDVLFLIRLKNSLHFLKTVVETLKVAQFDTSVQLLWDAFLLILLVINTVLYYNVRCYSNSYFNTHKIKFGNRQSFSGSYSFQFISHNQPSQIGCLNNRLVCHR